MKTRNRRSTAACPRPATCVWCCRSPRCDRRQTRVAARGVSSDPDPDRQHFDRADVVTAWCEEREQREEAQHVQARHRCDHRRQCPPLSSAQRCPEHGAVVALSNPADSHGSGRPACPSRDRCSEARCRAWESLGRASVAASTTCGPAARARRGQAKGSASRRQRRPFAWRAKGSSFAGLLADPSSADQLGDRRPRGERQGLHGREAQAAVIRLRAVHEGALMSLGNGGRP